MRSRRTFLAGLGTVGIAGLAGCSGLPFLGQNQRDRPDFDVPTDAIPPIEWPASPFPVAVPDALADTHRERANALLDGVPVDPSVPNHAVATKIQSRRERVAAQLDRVADEPVALDRLSWWRRWRGSAADVAGAYRAATGQNDGATLSDRRRTVRDRLGSFESDHEYRAETVREAVLVHAPLERLISRTRRRAGPDPGYPDDPLADPFRAGDAIKQVEVAAATLNDARRLKDTYLTDRSAVTTQWSALIDATDRLRFAVSETIEPVRRFLDAGPDAFDHNLDLTPAHELFTTAASQARAAENAFHERRDEGSHATAVIEAGETLAAVEALRTAIEGIQDGGYQDEVTRESIEQTARRANDAIDAIRTAEADGLAVRIARPALSWYESISAWIEEGHAGPLRQQGALAWTELYARAVLPAAEFVNERLAKRI
ncbi:hypothetical protein [Halorhabdus sp. CUG00001]|uniref:hypothetical protein n=1 Tax=Halorhabdus sp. CUG00001 TaxID=2600297 RepID=UPI00131C1690|nr:hypothetical protein [Halorhabdus sp. CUG00001]